MKNIKICFRIIIVKNKHLFSQQLNPKQIFIIKEALLYNLSDISDEQTIKIQEYLNLNGTNIDWIFYYVLLSIQMLLHKYYNADGTFKTIL